MNSTSESLLLRLKSSNDQQAWSTFVELYTPLIFYWARRVGLHTNDAADLAQDVLTLVFQKLPNFDYDANMSFRGWLRTVTLNRYRESLRKRTLGAKTGTDSLLGKIASVSTPSAAQSTWDLSYQQSLVARSMELLQNEFQPKTWSALRRYVLDGVPATEAAQEHGLSVSTVYAAKSRLMSRLREKLEGLL